MRNGVTLSELHKRAVRSLLAEAKYTPMGPHSTSQTGSRPCPRYTTKLEYVSMDQSRMLPSCDAESRDEGDCAVPYNGSKERE
jgi:hypothetical protein